MEYGDFDTLQPTQVPVATLRTPTSGTTNHGAQPQNSYQQQNSPPSSEVSVEPTSIAPPTIEESQKTQAKQPKKKNGSPKAPKSPKSPLEDLYHIMERSEAFDNDDLAIVKTALADQKRKEAEERAKRENEQRRAKLEECATKIRKLTEILQERTDILNAYSESVLDKNPMLNSALVDRQAIIMSQLENLKGIYFAEQQKIGGETTQY